MHFGIRILVRVFVVDDMYAFVPHAFTVISEISDGKPAPLISTLYPPLVPPVLGVNVFNTRS